MRDQHWRSIAFHCGPCNNEFEFIVHQEHGSEEQDFILKAMKVDDKTHIPGKYKTALKSYDEMLDSFRNISQYVIKELYRTYFSDFAFFGYELDEFLAVAKTEDPNDPFHEVRQWARVTLSKKFKPYKKKFFDNECDESYGHPDYDQVPEWSNFCRVKMCHFQFFCHHSENDHAFICAKSLLNQTKLKIK